MPYRFQASEFLPRPLFEAITDVRVNNPDVVGEEAARRRKRAKLTRDGKLCVLAADHAGRGVTNAGSDPMLLANRHEYLARVLRVLTDPEFDGVLGTPDIVDELFIVNYLVRKGGGPSFLDDKVILGCMQNGGIFDVVGEIDDRFTAYSAESIAKHRLDGGKMLWRFVPEDERTLKTLDYVARAVKELHRLDLYAFVEPMPFASIDGKFRLTANAHRLVRLANICAGLGDSSVHTWLKIPYVENLAQVSLGTTLPILLLGGEVLGDPTPLLRDFETGMRAGANIRGALVGRNVLFPGEDDPLAIALAVSQIVHRGVTAEKALQHVADARGREMDALTRWVHD